MRIEFHRTGAERKELVNALGEILGIRPKYKGMPSAAYEIGTFTVTRDGVLEYEDSFPDDEMENLLEQLADRGIAAAPAEMVQAWLAARETELSGESETEPQEANMGLTVQVPLDKVKVGNLTSILDAKGHPIQKALGIDSTPIEVTEETVSFPWFSELPEPEEIHAYTHLISALCEMSVNQKRITAKEKEVENEKYAFRCFLLRLGFIGAEYKVERRSSCGTSRDHPLLRMGVQTMFLEVEKVEEIREELHRYIDNRCDALLVRLSGARYAGESLRGIRLFNNAGRFKGTKPETLLFPDGREIHVKTWKEAVDILLADCASDPDRLLRLQELKGRVFGKQRLILAGNPDGMNQPRQVYDGLWMETKYDTETLLNVLMTRILDVVGYDYSRVRIVIREGGRSSGRGYFKPTLLRKDRAVGKPER